MAVATAHDQGTKRGLVKLGLITLGGEWAPGCESLCDEMAVMYPVVVPNSTRKFFERQFVGSVRTNA
jgi:hypothetical protein